MQEFRTTRHADIRMQQRGLRPADLEWAMAIATRVSDDTLLVLESDVDREISQLKAAIQRTERLRGLKVVVTDGEVVTMYRPRSRNLRRTLREWRA